MFLAAVVACGQGDQLGHDAKTGDASQLDAAAPADAVRPDAAPIDAAALDAVAADAQPEDAHLFDAPAPDAEQVDAPPPSCDDEGAGSITELCAAQGRLCVEDIAGAACGSCLSGWLESSGGVCVNLITCAELDCGGLVCVEADPDALTDAFCLEE